MTRRAGESGFTLLEAMVAMAILALVVTQFLGTRTNALMDAAEARDWRVAREIAEQYLSELEAGAREVRPQSGTRLDVEDYEGFSYRIVIGEAAIADAEGDLADMADSSSPTGYSTGDRLSWQRERDMLRRAQDNGMSMLDYEEQLREEELEEKIPTEDDLEDVAIFVTFPNRRPSEEAGNDWKTFTLKKKISTMAIEGLTPEKAQIIADQRGGDDALGGEGANAGGGLENAMGGGNR